jgi:hypothetical protein
VEAEPLLDHPVAEALFGEAVYPGGERPPRVARGGDEPDLAGSVVGQEVAGGREHGVDRPAHRVDDAGHRTATGHALEVGVLTRAQQRAQEVRRRARGRRAVARLVGVGLGPGHEAGHTGHAGRHRRAHRQAVVDDGRRAHRDEVGERFVDELIALVEGQGLRERARRRAGRVR